MMKAIDLDLAFLTAKRFTRQEEEYENEYRLQIDIKTIIHNDFIKNHL